MAGDDDHHYGATAPASTDTTAAGATTDTTMGEPVTLHIGGTFALTGAVRRGLRRGSGRLQDYVKWVNDNKMVAPWYSDKTIPGERHLRRALG